MAISVETLAAAKKYTDKMAASVDEGGIAIIPNDSIDKAKLSAGLKETINEADEHVEHTTPSDTGAHGLRYYNGALQYNDGTKWVTLSIADLLI